MSKHEYIVNTDDNARKRLTLQHKLYEASSLETLNQANISPDAFGLEVGCGAGDMTLHLADKLKEGGKLLSVDVNDEQIEHARSRVAAAGYNHVEFKNHCITKLSQLDQQYDFIYCRMVLHHLTDASVAIDEMVKCLNPNGVLIIEEPVIHDDSFCYPHSDAIEAFIDLSRQLFVKSGNDFEVAKYLHEWLDKRGLKQAYYSIHHPLLKTQNEKMIYAMGLKDLTPQLLKHGISNQANIDSLYNELVEFATQKHVLTWVRMHSIISGAYD